MKRVLVGSREDRVEMPVAGSDGLPPLRPIFVRPAVRLDPDARPSRILMALRAADRILWGPRASIGTWICVGVILAVILSLVVQVVRSHGAG